MEKDAQGVRFLLKEEYKKTEELARICFGAEDFDRNYYEKDIYDNLVCVKEKEGRIVSMAHLAPRRVYFEDGGSREVYYILYVATLPEERHKGFMDEVLKKCFLLMEDEEKPFTFLLPVNPDIYRHLGFIYDWECNDDERGLLYADEGLSVCSAKLLYEKNFKVPVKIR